MHYILAEAYANDASIFLSIFMISNYPASAIIIIPTVQSVDQSATEERFLFSHSRRLHIQFKTRIYLAYFSVRAR